MRHPVVLCVDDEVEGLIGREALLKQNGCAVLISTSPFEALRLLKSCYIDAVILDFQMPEMRGDMVASRMKLLKPEVPIMLLSGHDSLPEEVLDHVDKFCSKRETPRKFLAAVQGLLADQDSFFSQWLRDWKRKAAA